jgi:hypothetical protein
MTALQVLRQRGISASEHETMYEFRGTLDSRNDAGKPKAS